MVVKATTFSFLNVFLSVNYASVEIFVKRFYAEFLYDVVYRKVGGVARKKSHTDIRGYVNLEGALVFFLGGVKTWNVFVKMTQLTVEIYFCAYVMCIV